MAQHEKSIDTPLPFEVRKAVSSLGERIRIARIRRRMSQDELALACDISRRTLYRIESGEAGIAVGNIFAVLWKLGLLDSTSVVANPDLDEHGKILESARMPQRVRSSASDIDNDF